MTIKKAGLGENIYLECFSKSDIPNRNGYTIPKEVLAAAIKEYLDNPPIGGTYMEPHAPDEYNPPATVGPSEAPHKLIGLSSAGSKFGAVIKPIETPAGKNLSKILEGHEFEFNAKYLAENIDDSKKIHEDITIFSIDLIRKD